MKNFLIIALLLLSSTQNAYDQFYYEPDTVVNTDTVPPSREEEIIDNYYKSYTIWSFPITIIVMKRFSPDYGLTWKRAGVLGGNLRPFIQDNPIALKYLNTYRTIRIAGIIQMWVLAPYCLYKQIELFHKSEKEFDYRDPKPTKTDPTYAILYGAFLVTGEITYQLIAKGFFKKALIAYYEGIDNEKVNSYLPKFGIGFDNYTKSPTLSLVWSLERKYYKAD